MASAEENETNVTQTSTKTEKNEENENDEDDKNDENESSVGGLNNNNNINTNKTNSKSVKKPNLDKVVEKINHNNKKEITSSSSSSHNNRKNFKMSDLIRNMEEKEQNGTQSNDEEEEDEAKSETEDHESQSQHNASAALAAAQQLMGANPAMFNPAMFPTGQAFQNAVAQFTANAVANNMDMDNVALLKSALFTLQQQQFLQFQLIQHLHSQLLRNNTGERASGEENNDAERSETESEILAKRDEEMGERSRRSGSAGPKGITMQYDSPLKRLEEQSARQELDLR